MSKKETKKVICNECKGKGCINCNGFGFTYMNKDYKNYKYKLIVDYGKPYKQEIKTDEELKTELKKLKEIAEEEDFFYFDLKVLDSKGKDITKTQLKMLERI